MFSAPMILSKPFEVSNGANSSIRAIKNNMFGANTSIRAILTPETWRE